MILNTCIQKLGQSGDLVIAVVLYSQLVPLRGADNFCPTKSPTESVPGIFAPVENRENDVKQQIIGIPKPAERDVISDSKLRELISASPKMKDLVSANRKPIGDARPSLDDSAFSKSIILFDGTNFTLIPQGCILRLPANLREHVVSAPRGSFLLWPVFLKQNAKWLSTQEVPMEMALGDKDATADIMQKLDSDLKLRVAVYRSNPICILEASNTTQSDRK